MFYQLEDLAKFGYTLKGKTQNFWKPTNLQKILSQKLCVCVCVCFEYYDVAKLAIVNKKI